MSEHAPEGQLTTRAEWAAGWRVVLAAGVVAAAGLIL